MKDVKRFMVTLSVAGLMALTACGSKEAEAETPVIVDQPADTTTAEDTEQNGSDATESADAAASETDEVSSEAKTIEPLPAYIDLANLGDCTVAVSFEKGDLTEENGEYTLHAVVYDYERFDMVDIAQMKQGDTLVIDGNSMKVESVEKTDSGAVNVNGDIEEGGVSLWTDDNGGYYEVGMDDYKSYYEVGEITLPLSDDFVLTDNSDLENPDKTCTAEELKKALDDSTDEYSSYYPNNCSLTIVDGKIISMNKEYTP